MRSSASIAMMKLREELTRIHATDVVLEAGFNETQLRNDDYPRADAKPSHPRVRLTFKKGGKLAMSMTCGGTTNWWYNVHLIAASLERMRALDRYGCIQSDEQYRGFASLPPGQPIATSEWASVEQACRFLADTGGLVYTGGSLDAAMLDRFYEQAAKRAHPDAGGSNEQMAKVNRARTFIREAMK
jgi:hypothetical protein